MREDKRRPSRKKTGARNGEVVILPSHPPNLMITNTTQTADIQNKQTKLEKKSSQEPPLRNT